MVNSNNLHLFILAILFNLLHVGNSKQKSHIEVTFEEIEGCDLKSKWCYLRPGIPIFTKVGLLGDPGVKLGGQEFRFFDGETGPRNIKP
ncbi:hypothetical protein MXB_2649 [Myxobolus squamalis]|nr:hypothetical protein MXB_2649 [Myxobolus squamalis]